MGLCLWGLILSTPDGTTQSWGLSFSQVFRARCISDFQHMVFCGGKEQALTELTFVPDQLPLHHLTFPYVLWKQGLPYVPGIQTVCRVTKKSTLFFPSCEKNEVSLSYPRSCWKCIKQTIFLISFAIFIKMEDKRSILSSKKKVKVSKEWSIWGLCVSLQFAGFSFCQKLNCSMKYIYIYIWYKNAYWL